MAKTAEDILDPFLARIDSALGTSYSAVLYGSAARGDWVPGRSDINLILVVDELSPSRLGALEPAFTAWRKTQSEPPLLMGRTEWEHATDSFPIEITDMQSAYRVLRGSDPMAGLTVAPADLRRALEREIRGKLLRLRQGFVVISKKPNELGQLAVESLSTILLLFRCLAVLRARPLQRDPAAAIDEAARIVGFRPEQVLAILEHRAESRWSCSLECFLEYLDAVEQTARLVDQLEPGDQA